MSNMTSPCGKENADNNIDSSIKSAIKEAKDGARIPARGFAMQDKDAGFTPLTFTRHPLGDKDILIEIAYTGICHSDIHAAKSEWGKSAYPIVPGHEIAGRVVAVGKDVKKFKVGDNAGVGCMVNSCGVCPACLASHEQFCERGQTVMTYNSPDCFHGGENTYGGYSNNIVLSEDFAIKVPKNAPLEYVAPLLCAGITTYSPLKFSKVGKDSSVAIAGFGGLGLMAFKYAKLLGARVSILARNDKKRQIALDMGADGYYSDLREVKERFSLIISTIPTAYDPMPYINLLKYGGELAIVGLPPSELTPSINIASLVHAGHKKVYGSLIGGIEETQEMLDFSLRHKIYPEIEIISCDRIDFAYESLLNNTAKFRYVLDIKKTI